MLDASNYLLLTSGGRSVLGVELYWVWSAGLICVVGLIEMKAGGSATSRESYPLPGNKNFYFHDVPNSLMYILVNGLIKLFLSHNGSSKCMEAYAVLGEASRMAGAQECNAYNELRRRNVERNESMMRSLGIAKPRAEAEV